jgi:hypothetical protein
MLCCGAGGVSTGRQNVSMSECAYLNLIIYEWERLKGIEGNLISIDENRKAQVGGMISAVSWWS